MTITTELKVTNNVTAGRDTVKVSSNCSSFIDIHHELLPGGKLQLHADELREFLFRSLPNEELNKLDHNTIEVKSQ